MVSLLEVYGIYCSEKFSFKRVHSNEISGKRRFYTKTWLNYYNLVWNITCTCLQSPNIWSLAARHANFCNCSCEPEMILELNSVNTIGLICLNAEILCFLAYKDMGCFAAFIQTVVGRQLISSAKIHLMACQTSNVWWPNVPRLIAN